MVWGSDDQDDDLWDPAGRKKAFDLPAQRLADAAMSSRQNTY
jgi:hypothetical protein